jgi:hypothetical protein
MKRAALLFFTLCLGLCLAGTATAVDKPAIQNNVDGIVESINQGENAESFNPNDYDPYVFIMEKDGNLLVHPELAGKSLKEAAEPVYDALMHSTAEGTWVDYVWKEQQKHSYVRTTGNGLIVGSGYTE